jgi:membrane protease YdiL (CAAX protease family)
VTREQRGVLLEVVGLYLVTLVVIRGVVQLVGALGLHEVFLLAVPILFMYAPVWWCRWRGIDPFQYPMHLPLFRDREPWLQALKYNAVLIGVVVVPFLVGYHVWQTQGVPLVEDLLGVQLYPVRPTLQWTWPESLWMLVGYHIFFVAIPEEMFYRGWMQSRLDEVFGKRWSVLGTTVGPGLLITCVLFALGHSIVVLQWWHLFIVVPSLAFGWLRERTGGIVAGALFHAWCNVTVTTLDTLYGIVQP